jgi:hypothetical protein
MGYRRFTVFHSFFIETSASEKKRKNWIWDFEVEDFCLSDTCWVVFLAIHRCFCSS